MNFGTQLRKRREKLGLTQTDIANRLFVTRQTISNWEQGKSYPDLNMLVKISEEYKISVDSLLKNDGQLKGYLEQGKAYNTFNIFQGLFTVLYGLFFLITGELNYDSSVTQFCLWGIIIIFLIFFIYGEYTKPFFLGINQKTYWLKRSKVRRERSLLGKSCNVLLLAIMFLMVVMKNIADCLLMMELTIAGLMYIFQKYMWKQT
ncbi:helix-turn-helix domain-containing protein [Limosilactobacillus agrestimuris]|uniref:helix-turn-helix domain-containing protein n=1 Tax=Limosilactobacillus agrestimuris TaxID=2941331 RepID=UPI00203CDF4B|nr:helix-turn-helix transcriptional regulator [Limosilactobacillus agrestimuris]